MKKDRARGNGDQSTGISHWLLLLSILTASSFVASAGPAPSPTLEQTFLRPPRQAQPWVFWVWLRVNTSRAALVRDLEQMKAKGIAGCILYDCGAGRWSWNQKIVQSGKDYRAVRTDDYKNSYMTPVPGGPLPAWSPRWRQLVGFCAGQCARLGLSFVVSDGLANTSGFIPEKYGEQKLVWTETSVRGPTDYDATLPEAPVRAPRGNFPHPRFSGYRRDVAVLAVPAPEGFSAAQVINLTARMDAAGRLRWAVPPGNWKILRFTQVPTGAHNSWGYFCDSLSAEALDQTWAATMAPLLREMTPDQRRGLKGIEDDSWEAGKATWTKAFPAEFKKRRGYDLTPYLPIIAGLNVGDATLRARVLRDYRLTISDLIAQNHYAHLQTLARDNGLTCYSEAAGPNYDQADELKTCSRVDQAMAEFWMPSAHRPAMDDRFLLRNAANANHIYGKRITMCEAFTSLGPEWQESPFSMKPVADQAFCDGLNRICFHNFSQSPSLTAKPGYVYCAGTHYEPGITWWNETPAFNAYLARCSALLQEGKFVADAVIYRGDNIGHGEPRKVILPTLGEGYDHDNCNSEVLLTRMNVRNGRIVLPDGMSYRVLVLPDSQPMLLRDLEKLADLIDAGATVIGPPPDGMAGMPLSPEGTQKFNRLSARLWGGLDGIHLTQKNPGAGRLVWGRSARQVLESDGVPPDFEVSGVSSAGTIDWIHRDAGPFRIYYVASRWAHPEEVTCKFRVSGQEPELWDPVSGEIRPATAFHQEDGRTILPLKFGPCGSVFVVFHNPIPKDAAGSTASNDPRMGVLGTLSGPWTVRFNPHWGGPASTMFDHLIDWTNSPDPGIRYYSGTAVYSKRFDVPGASRQGQRLLLDLGDVENVATVRLNGKDLGVVWTRPARIDITGVARPQDNDLEIAVVNLWPNRLIGDSSLPKAQRLTQTNIHKFVPTSPLLSSGLIGPVRLLTAQVPE